MKKTTLIIAVLVLVLVAGAGYLYWQNNPKGDSASVKVKSNLLGAQIVWVDGGVEYKQSGGDWKRAVSGLNLVQGDSVETLADGKVIINLDDGSALRLDKQSQITLTSLSPEHFIVTNDKGQVYSRVAKSSRIFDVAIGKVVFQSMGTAYKTVNQENYKGVEVYESKVKVVDEAKTETVVEEGNKYLTLNKADQKIEKKITKLNPEDLSKDEFLKWNKNEDQKIGEALKELTTTTPATSTAEVKKEEGSTVIEEKPVVQGSGITLSAVKVSNGIKFTWQVNNVNVDSGFKLVKSLDPNPVYPGDDYQYLTNSAQRSFTWTIKDGKSYNFRVCQYLGGKCGVYSNNIKITAPIVVVEDKPADEPTGGVNSISLSSSGAGKVSWSVNGYSSSGYKLVWSKNSGPTYPCREGDKYNYYSNPSTFSGSMDAFDGSGSYYVRVCEYLGGKCGTYSNQITVNLGE